MVSEGESESPLLKRWRRVVKSDPELDKQVHETASHLLSGIRRYVKEKKWRIVERVIMDTSLVPLFPDRPAYIA